ncbi:MAG: GNAT family N-acetyltransferase [Lachnospiraceae bacterium]|nr:GNAT family N-acetyltransferase [Lachnospiraceae bacterium]
MTIEDYDLVYSLWLGISGFGIRTIDDSREGIEKFLKRNPGFSVVAVDDETGKVVGAILSGHDGRRACFYHVCVDKNYRKRGIARRMVNFAVTALHEEGINKVNIIAFKKNRLGNGFWTGLGWTLREDLNYYDLTLNENNITNFIE